ncbi:MAG: hypothetical protein JWQ64_3662 [Subtercola sp.]|nr:hypothetical protein [Subtercola sp.]
MTTLTAEHPTLVEHSSGREPAAADGRASSLERPTEDERAVPHEQAAEHERAAQLEHASQHEHHPLLGQPLTSDQQIEERVMCTVGTACRHQLWFLLLTSSDLQVPIALPCDDLPLEPSETHVDTLLAFCAGLMADRGATQLVAVWERPGRGALNQADARWAQTIATTCARRGIRLRAQLLSHTRGVCLLQASDLLDTEGDEAAP